MRILLLSLCIGCYSPDIQDKQFTCVESDSCPTGFTCICHQCRKDAKATCDGEDLGVSDLAAADLAAADLATADLASLPGCSSGPRAPNDPGKAKIALCPAAWAVGGIHPNPGTMCGRQVDATGKNGATNCTTEDNCAAGWHVCVDENDVMMKGINQNECKAVTGAFYIAAQKGGPPPSPGPPVCDNSAFHSVFGCGAIVQMGGAPICSLFNAVLLNPPNGSDNCAASTGNNFVCGSNTIEGDAVTKPTRQGGGVMCCQD